MLFLNEKIVCSVILWPSNLAVGIGNVAVVVAPEVEPATEHWVADSGAGHTGFPGRLVCY